MFHNDPVTKEIIAFFILAAIGPVLYVAATLIARWISPIPRHIYIGRLVFMFVFCVLILIYLPSAAVAFSGNRERYYERIMEVRGMGMMYGLPTIGIWVILALLNRPKKIPDDNTV